VVGGGGGERSLSRCQLLFLVAAGSDAFAQQTLLVVGVVDGERPAVAAPQLFNVAPQDSHAERMESRDQRRGGRPVFAVIIGEQFFDARLHLAGRLIGERHGQYVFGPRVVGRDQARDAIRDDPSFTRAGARQNQDWAFLGGDGLALLRVQTVQIID